MRAYNLGALVGTLLCAVFAVGFAVIFAQWIAKKAGASKQATLWIGVIVGLLVTVTCVAGKLVSSSSTKDIDATPTPTPTPSASPSQAVPSAPVPSPNAAVRKVTLTLPAKLGNRPPSKSSDFKKLAESLEPFLPNGSDITGVFGEIAKGNQVLVLAAKSSAESDLEAELASIFSWFDAAAMPVKGAVTVPAGPLGGKAKCGTVKVDGFGTALCVWASEGSIGILWWFPGTLARAKGEFLKLRAQVEHRA